MVGGGEDYLWRIMASEEREIYQRMAEPPYFSFQWVPLEENEETFDAAILV